MKQISLKAKYGQYKKLFKAEKKQNNIKNGVRMATFKKFSEYMEESETDSVKKILDFQRKVAQEDKKKVWSQYKKMVKSQLEPGDTTVQDNTYWGKNIKNVEGLGYHRTFSGLMGDGNAVHFLIAQRMAGGEKTADVLADFGY